MVTLTGNHPHTKAFLIIIVKEDKYPVTTMTTMMTKMTIEAERLIMTS